MMVPRAEVTTTAEAEGEVPRRLGGLKGASADGPTGGPKGRLGGLEVVESRGEGGNWAWLAGTLSTHV